MKKTKLGAVVSGGGALGACVVGQLAKKNRSYDYVIGCSTGSLMAPFIALGDWERLRKAYTSVNQSSIFNINPFNNKGNIKVIKSIFRIVIGKKTIGETENLKKLIDDIFTFDDYLDIRSSGKDVIITVSNLSQRDHTIEYKNIKDCSFEEFKNWMWVSCNVPVVCSLVKINDNYYADGGICESLPLIKAIEDDCTEVDCYIHDVNGSTGKRKDIENIFHLLGRTFSVIRKEVKDNDIITGLILAKTKNIKVNTHYLPYELASNALVFDQVKMQKWYELGYSIG